MFMILHIPRVVPIHKEEDVEVKWENDKGSVYRPWCFFLAFLTNAIIVVMFMYQVRWKVARPRGLDCVAIRRSVNSLDTNTHSHYSISHSVRFSRQILYHIIFGRNAT